MGLRRVRHDRAANTRGADPSAGGSQFKHSHSAACADHPIHSHRGRSSLPHWSCDPGVITAGQAPTQSFQSPPGLPSLARTLSTPLRMKRGPAKLTCPRPPQGRLSHPKGSAETHLLLVDDTRTPGARAGKGRTEIEPEHRRQAGSDSCRGEQRLRGSCCRGCDGRRPRGTGELFQRERPARGKQTRRKHSQN